MVARVIADLAHATTGIDIHPGAQIGEGLVIIHGTGLVIGETARIGRNVQLNQGVTLGAKPLPPGVIALRMASSRHPIVEDDVVIQPGATVIGPVTIGKGAVIGGNVWITEDVEPGSIIQQSAVQVRFR